MKKISKSIVLIALFCILLTACQFSSKDTQEEYATVELQEQPSENPSTSLQFIDEKQESLETNMSNLL